MTVRNRIITVGLAPAWDVVCRGELEWGMHAQLDSQEVRPAGKALNVSRALAWMGRESVAAGLWGRDDYERMLGAVGGAGELVQVRMTPAEGHTRLNITVVDAAGGREMHLRTRSDLARPESLDRLATDLRRIVSEGDICVFSGAMPDGPLLEPTVDVVRTCHEAGARIVVDTHGVALKMLVEAGLPWLIAPNVEELSELLGGNIPDSSAELAAAGRSLLGNVAMALISRGENGAMVATTDGVWTGRHTGRSEVLETVGCGDYLLAGFLDAIAAARSARAALEQAIKVATARAKGLSETAAWHQAADQIPIEMAQLHG